MTTTISGRVWLFGDQINTDDMFPGFAMGMTIKEASRHMFAASRPGWSELVQPGDVVVAGSGFGIGSSRPVPLLFRELGVSFIVAEQFNSLFFRNCINYGLLPLVCPGITAAVSEGEEVTFDPEAWTLTTARGQSLAVKPLPASLLEIVEAGGMLSRLEKRGLLTPPSVTT